MNLTTKKLFTSPTYKKSTYILTMLSLMHGVTGYGFIYVFERICLKHYISTDYDKQFFSYSEANWTISLLSFLAAIGAITFLNLMKRRSLLLTGQAITVILMSLIGVAVMFEGNLLAIYLFLLYLVAFYLSVSTTIWIYITEISTDRALGYSIFVIYLSLTLITFLAELLESISFIFFFAFAVLALSDFLLVYFLVEDTKGLNDREKKLLYAQASYKP